MAILFMRDKHMSASERADGKLELRATLNDTDQIMELRCLVSYPELVIQEADFTFLRSPGPECLEAVPNAKKLLGLQITSGYNHRVKELLGGVQGCVHMVDLAVEIGHTAVQAKLKKLDPQTAGLDQEEKKQFWKAELKGQCVRYR